MAERHELSDIKGVIPALISCFAEDGEFDEKRQRAVVRYLLSKKIGALYLTGSTGEAFMMTPDERKRVVEVVVDEVGGRLPLIVHVGAISTKVSVDLAKHAEACGVDAVSSVPPFYWRFSDEEIFDYYRELTASIDVPMVIYNLALAGLVGYKLLKRIARIDGVNGMKYTASTHDEIMRMKEEVGKEFVVYSGADQMAMSGLMFGADGIIGSFYNMIPEIYIDLYNAVKAGDLNTAHRKQTQANAVIAFAHDYSYVSVIKRSLSWAGVDGGYCRKPFAAISPEQEQELKSGFRAVRDKYEIEGVEVFAAL